MKKYEAVVNADGEVFILSDEEISSAYCIPPKVFKKVETFVNGFKDRLDNLLKEQDSRGNLVYHEEDHHGQFVNLFHSWLPDVKSSDISNSLSALGY